MIAKSLRIAALFAAGLAFLIAVCAAVRRAPTVVPLASAAAPPARAEGDSQPVVRFVKNPEVAPPLDAKDIEGKAVNKDNWPGKVVLVNFWATWCPPCRREMPDLEKLYQRFAPQGLVVLAVSDEKRETVEGFLAKQHYTFPVLLDAGRKVNTAFGIEGIPNSFLFDREGKLVGQAIDMRTERQFLEMFRAAGLE